MRSTAAAEGDRVNSLVTATRRRRALFPSVDAALANYAAKPPLDALDPAALDAYVRYGFHADVDGAGVRLKCDPELEARTFEAGTSQRTWELLPEIAVPVIVVSGRVERRPTVEVRRRTWPTRCPTGGSWSWPSSTTSGR